MGHTRWAAFVTSNPGPENPPTTNVRQRLTVARAGARERADLVDALQGFHVDQGALMTAAEGFAMERSADRAAARARLDAAAARLALVAEEARGKLDRTQAARQALLDGAIWAERAEADLPRLVEAVGAARDALEARQAEQRAARADIDRVLEQRAAANAAMEDADRQLADLVGVGMDESGLRRELEAAGDAARSARARHAAAVVRLQDLLAERDAIEHRRAELGAAMPAPSPAHVGDHDDLVRAALRAWTEAARSAGLDPDAQALADAFRDLGADLAVVEQRTGPRPDPLALKRAQEDVDRCASVLERIEADSVVPALTPPDRAALDAAHAAAIEAEERTDRRFGGAGARRTVEQARATERELLERFGFASYLDVVLSGGRGVTSTPERLAAERAYLAAKAARDKAQKALRTSPELDYLESEHARLLKYAVERLGVDPGDAVGDLLRAHPRVPGRIVDDLRDALAVAGLRPIGLALPQAAEAWLSDRPATTGDGRKATSSPGEIDAEMAALDARGASLEEELAAARQEEARCSERLDLSGRSVGAFEAELSVRAGEDSSRVQRFAAAEQLRSQVEALAATLVRAEHDARGAVDRATEEALDAEAGLDRTQNAVADLARRARKLADDLPLTQRPSGDPLTTLPALAAGLRGHADCQSADIATADAEAVAATSKVDEAMVIAAAAGTGVEGPQPEDVEDGLQRLLMDHATEVVVLDEPFVSVEVALRPRLLDVVRTSSGMGPLVLLTDDADILSWAIGLPADQGTVVPADSLLNLRALTADTQTFAPSPTDATSESPARRRAGHR